MPWMITFTFWGVLSFVSLNRQLGWLRFALFEPYCSEHFDLLFQVQVLFSE